MADFTLYRESMERRRSEMSPEERSVTALEQIADMMWGIHEELMEIRQRLPNAR